MKDFVLKMALSTNITYLNLPSFVGNQGFNDQIGHNLHGILMAQLATALSLNAEGYVFESY